jgi:hypothetical protein
MCTLDNEATIKIIRKSGSAKLRHVSRTHKINLASTYEQFRDPNISLKYVNTKEQVADIFTKALPPPGMGPRVAAHGRLVFGGAGERLRNLERKRACSANHTSTLPGGKCMCGGAWPSLQ